MKKSFIWFSAIIFMLHALLTDAAEAQGTGSMIAGPLIRVWAEAYGMHSPSGKIKYKGSSPAEGIRSLQNKDVDFSCVDMPMKFEMLKKNDFKQFPVALGAVAPIVNLPGVYPGQFRLDGQTLGDILLGVITKWNDPAIAALNPNIKLPDETIIIVHRASPPRLSTIIGDYLAKTHASWGDIKGDGMAGDWPPGSIEVKNPVENIETIKKTTYSLGYGPIQHILKNGLSYAQLKNREGKFVSPSDDNIISAATNADWNDTNGFGAVLTNQPGINSWPLSMASYVLMRNKSENREHVLEALKYFKYSFRYGGLKAIQSDFIPLPDSVKKEIRISWSSIVDAQGVPVVKD